LQSSSTMLVFLSMIIIETYIRARWRGFRSMERIEGFFSKGIMQMKSTKKPTQFLVGDVIIKNEALLYCV